ncbi:MAG: bifunctional 4-hydroxy-2-oxoglutarate aldolase/2-dehydro-3-deoxy-phosphogluconate aldolase [Bacteroidetes bacterium]|nr:bifunctional 4-hydroxy-2-oxoglutarate aldolase/2-dehydro-3-deoxy-phosphogluconate aldolase [Bacteroidota bacterium]
MKTKNLFSWELFRNMPVIGIIRNLSVENVEEIAPLFQNSGLTTLEITLNTKNALPIIKRLCLKYTDLNIGAGTVLELNDLKAAIDHGASFIVTPVLNEEIIIYCVKHGIPVLPGAFTPTEIYKAWKCGASAIKIFPASQLGPSYIKELKLPLNEIKLLPTGGISIENLEDYFKAGATGVGMGSSLFDKKLILAGDMKNLSLHFRKIVATVRKFIKS